MRLRVQLVLAFFLLAVVPLAGISIYNYNSSLRALRQAAEEESAAMAAELGERMESVSTDLNHRIQRLGAFPFRTLMRANANPQDSPDKDVLVKQLMAQMGETASFLKALEFTPMAPPPAARVPPPAAFLGRPVAHGQRHPGLEMRGLVIHMPGDPDGQRRAEQDFGPNPDLNRSMMHIEVPMPAAPPSPPPPGLDPKQAKEFGDLVLQNLEKGAKALEEAVGTTGKAHEAAIRAIEAGKKNLELSLGRSFATEVRREGALVGEVKAQVSTRQILRHVLSRTQRRQGEIPFAIDAEGGLYAADPADLPKIQSLPLPKDVKPAGNSTQKQPEKNWVIVTRKDPASGMTLGIARPLTERLDELRHTAVRNLAYGMGMVCLALIGIIPLSGRMTRNLTVLTEGAERLARGDLETRVEIKSRNEFGKLAQAFNLMARDLSENQKHLVEKERLRKELEMCRRIQEELLPRQTLRAGIVEVKGVSIPAREVGGDFFNYFPLPNGDLALLIGDVSGKGLPAALLMANLQATIQARLPLELDLAKLAEQLDHHIGGATPSELYLTLFIAILETNTRILRYVNAGHNPQFALRAEGAVERLESTGRPLGLLPGGGYTGKQVELKKGDALFFYTDGLVETANEAGQEFGMDRLEKLVLAERLDGLEGMLARVERTTCEYRGTVEVADDATMLLVAIGEHA